MGNGYDYSLSQLSRMIQISQKNPAELSEEDKEAWEKFNSKETGLEIIDMTDTKKLEHFELDSLPVSIDESTRLDLHDLSKINSKLYDIIVNDIRNAHLSIQCQIGKDYPKWDKLFEISCISATLIDDNYEWKQYCENKEINIVIPPSEAILPILIRFTKKNPKDHHHIIMYFADFICLTNKNEISRLDYLFATY